MRKKRFLFLLLTFIFTSAASAVSYAASVPTLMLSSKNGSASQSLNLNGLSDECYGLQITLTTDNSNKEYEFTRSGSTGKTDVYATFKQDSSDVTLYVVSSETPLNSGNSILIGRLSAENGFTIKSASDIRVLDKDLNKISYGSANISVSSSSSSDSGGGGGSNNNGTVQKIDLPSDVENGTVEVSPSSAKSGETVTITTVPDEGYELSSIIVKDKNGKELKLTQKGINKFTFTMPSSNISIHVEFAEKDPSKPAVPNQPVFNVDDVKLPFDDVNETDWYCNAVKYVYGQNMMSGTSTTSFSPDMTTTRAMIVTILHRLEGEPDTYSSKFDDVTDGQYYTKAVAWASANNIVSGYGNGNFGPNDTITREQMASILYRYAQYKGYVSAETSENMISELSVYSDSNLISNYAVPAIHWANKNGIITGINETTLADRKSVV